MDAREFQELLRKYLSGKCTDEEKTVLENWYLRHEAEGLKPLAQMQLEEIERSTVSIPKKGTYRHLQRWVAAAAALLVVSVGIYLYQTKHDDGLTTDQLALQKDIAPGTSRATLKLANGRTIPLDEAQSGIIVGDEDITYTDGSVLNVMGSPVEASQPNSAAMPGTENGKLMTYDLVLTTPKGGTYQVTLPDGSNVWLNANSTLSYPSRFDDGERAVFLEGEAYFEVVSKKGSRQLAVGEKGQKETSQALREKSLRSSRENLPFKVITNGQTVEVLGTQFNISAYPEDPETQTTLVEGKVRLSLARALKEAPLVPDKQVILVPGEQGQLANGSFSKTPVNIEQAIAWKNGYFLFENELIGDVMAKISKWYDVEVVFEDDVATERFYGMIGREKKLSQVLKMLENTRTVHFKVKGNTIHIYKRLTS